LTAKIRAEIMDLENYLGFPIKRREITLKSKQPHDETFSYGLCQRFYGKEKELQRAIKITTGILVELVKQHDKLTKQHAIRYDKSNGSGKQIALFFSLLGDMHYIASDFTRSTNCFMKALSYNKTDITNWAGLMFSLRAIGEFEIFEDLIFNFEKVCRAWQKEKPRKNNSEDELDQQKISEIVRIIRLNNKDTQDKQHKNNKRVLGIASITAYCNERCVFCSVPNLNIQPSFEELKKRIIQMKKSGTTELMLTGGEPMLRKDLKKIITFANKQDFKEITIQTNGTIPVNKQELKELFEAGLSGMRVSFHSHIKKEYDEITHTRNNYKKALATLKAINEYKKKLAINITINSLNYNHLPELIKFLLKHYQNICLFSINFCDPIGRAAKDTWTVPRLSKVRPFLYESMKILKKSKITFMVDFVPLCFMEGYEDHCTEYNVAKENEEVLSYLIRTKENENRINKGDTHPKIKSDSCKFCRHDRYCKGLNKRYADLYWIDELLPVYEDNTISEIYKELSRYKLSKNIIDRLILIILKVKRNTVIEDFPQNEMDSIIKAVKKFKLCIKFIQSDTSNKAIIGKNQLEINRIAEMDQILFSVKLPLLKRYHVYEYGQLMGYPERCIKRTSENEKNKDYFKKNTAGFHNYHNPFVF